MQKESVSPELTSVAFDFFYWFSRFEFALKENNYLTSHADGARADPGWNEFVSKWGEDFKLSAESQNLLSAKPKNQVVMKNELAWKEVVTTDCKSDLGRVVRLLKTVRNNLFHGGKCGIETWDDTTRTYLLLTSGKMVLDQLADMADFKADYTRSY